MDQRKAPQTSRSRSQPTPGEDNEGRALNDHIAALSTQWRKQHERKARRQEKALFADAPAALADERLVLAAAARDGALAESLWLTQVQLAARLGTQLENPKTALALARALREITACRSSATERMADLLIAANTLRAQRRLANLERGPRLRSVA